MLFVTHFGPVPYENLMPFGTFLIVAARCPVCGEPVCLDRSTYQNNKECPLRLPLEKSRERRIRDGRPGVFSSGETRSSSGPCLPRVARDGRPAPYPTRHGESSIMSESSSVPALVALTLAFLLRGGKRPILYGQPAAFIPRETRSSSGALSSPGGPGWPSGPLSQASRRIFDHARVLFGTGLGRPHPCLPPRSRIGPRRRRQQRGDDHRRRHLSQMHAEGGPILPERPRGPRGGQGGQVLPGKEQGCQRLPPRQRDLLGDKGRADPDHCDRHGQGAGRQEGPDCHQDRSGRVIPPDGCRAAAANVLFVGTAGASERAPSPKILRVDTTVQQAMRTTEYEPQFSLTSLRPALVVPGDRDGRGRAVRGAGRVPLLRGRRIDERPDQT